MWLPALPRKWLLLTIAAAVALRMLFVFFWGTATPDSEVYADIAKTWLRSGIYGMEGAAGPVPTLIRLPGYPAFLAAIFAVAGIDHYNAVRFVQAAVDLLTGFVMADLARRVVSRRAGAAAFVLWSLCPFTVNYAAAPLTETLAIFTTALALWCAVIGLESRSLKPWIGCGAAVAYGILLRPDGGILLISIGLYLFWRLLRTRDWQHIVPTGVVVAAVALAPLVPWTIRNARTFHRFEPLVPQSATDPGEFVAGGFGAWMNTWADDYADLIDIGFHVDGEPINADDLPGRARGDAAEFARIQHLFAAYNEQNAMTRQVDAQFAEIAQARIRRAPFKYHVVLPVLRALDMWLRPRTELLDVDTHWWDIKQGWRDVTGVGRARHTQPVLLRRRGGRRSAPAGALAGPVRSLLSAAHRYRDPPAASRTALRAGVFSGGDGAGGSGLGRVALPADRLGAASGGVVTIRVSCTVFGAAPIPLLIDRQSGTGVSSSGS